MESILNDTKKYLLRKEAKERERARAKFLDEAKRAGRDVEEEEICSLLKEERDSELRSINSLVFGLIKEMILKFYGHAINEETSYKMQHHLMTAVGYWPQSIIDPQVAIVKYDTNLIIFTCQTVYKDPISLEIDLLNLDTTFFNAGH